MFAQVLPIVTTLVCMMCLVSPLQKSESSTESFLCHCAAFAESSDEDGDIIAVKAVGHAAVNIKLLENAFQNRGTKEEWLIFCTFLAFSHLLWKISQVIGI